MKIRSKAEFFDLWEMGVLGNRTRLWRDPIDAYIWGLKKSITERLGKYKPEIGFREIGKPGGAWTKVPWPEVPFIAQEWRNLGRKFIMDDGCPDEYKTIQGEVCRSVFGWEAYISNGTRLSMRADIAAGNMRTYRSSSVPCILQRFMDPSSYNDLEALLDLYPEATVEFTCFTRDVGMIPGRNTIFWEVRDY